MSESKFDRPGAGPAWRNARQRAITQVAAVLGDIDAAGASGEVLATMVVDQVLSILAEPDRDMISAGVAELDLAIGKGPAGRSRYLKNLTVTTWQAMLGRASR